MWGMTPENEDKTIDAMKSAEPVEHTEYAGIKESNKLDKNKTKFVSL